MIVEFDHHFHPFLSFLKGNLPSRLGFNRKGRKYLYPEELIWLKEQNLVIHIAIASENIDYVLTNRCFQNYFSIQFLEVILLMIILFYLEFSLFKKTWICHS